MHIERRRKVRRALCGGMVLVALATLPLWLWESVYVLAVSRPSWGSGSEALLFVLYLGAIVLMYGALAGAMEGLLLLGVSALTELLAKKRLAQPRWMAWIISLLALPGIAVLAARTFAGRRASQIPGKDVIALLLGLAGLAATYGLVRLAIGCRDRFRLRRWGPRQAHLLLVAMLLISLVFYLIDQRVLPRLYPFFHLTLTVLTVLAAQLGLAALYAGYRATHPWIGRLAQPGLALTLLVGAVAAGTFAQTRIFTSETLQQVVFEHTTVQSRLLRAAHRLGIAPGAGVRARGPEVKPAARPVLPKVAGPRLPGANVLLITVDALRADYLGFYGHNRPTSPRLDRWAKDAVRFRRGYCQVPHTSFSIASLMTGAYLKSVDPDARHSDHRTVAEVLRRYGYKTAAFFPPAVFYIDRSQFSGFERTRFGFEYVKYQYAAADKRVDQVLAFLDGHRSSGRAKQPVFIWAHFFEPHEPYVTHPGFAFGDRSVDRYQSEVAWVDSQVGRLLARVRTTMPQTVVALTADHGEEFGEHGGHYHGNALYEPQVRVPLAVSLPGVKGRDVAGAAQVIDLPATILSALDVPLPASMRGTDLGPWLAGAKGSSLPPVFAELEQKRMVVRRDHKLICDRVRGYCELYNLATDPGERRNLVQKEPDIAKELRGHLARWARSHVRVRTAAGDRSEALAMLERGRRGDSSALSGLVQLLEGGSPDLAREAAEVLAELALPGAKTALVKATGHRDPGVRIPATVGAARLGHRAALARLPELVGRADLPPRLRLLSLLAMAKRDDRAAVGPLVELLTRPRTGVYQRLQVIEALGRLGDATAASALRAQLKTLRTRLATIKALGKIKDINALPDLVRALERDRFTSWRQEAAAALGRIGGRKAVAALRRAVRRELEHDVVKAAAVALVKLNGLPMRGVKTVSDRTWRCADGACSLRLAGSCAGAARELLVVNHGESADAENRSVGPWTVRCGDTTVRKVPTTGAAVIALPATSEGPLTLNHPGPNPPTIGHLALRPRPRAR